MFANDKFPTLKRQLFGERPSCIVAFCTNQLGHSTKSRLFLLFSLSLSFPLHLLLLLHSQLIRSLEGKSLWGHDLKWGSLSRKKLSRLLAWRLPSLPRAHSKKPHLQNFSPFLSPTRHFGRQLAVVGDQLKTPRDIIQTIGP